MSPSSFVIGGLASEAIARSLASYSQALQHYRNRVNDDLQPRSPMINFFNVDVQNSFLCWSNAVYLVITFILFFYMKRKLSGFRLRWVLVVYDAVNVLLAGYIAVQTLEYKFNHGGLLLCNPLATDIEGIRISKVFLLFYLQKYFEFFDTWFFILRKSSRQVTFLHLFHHSSITVVVGSILPFDFNGDVYLPILLNSANHTMIYLHYLLATLGFKSWWSQYITFMQLIQFILIFAQSLLAYRVGPTCGSPDFAKVLMIVYMGSMVALFANFFLQKYIFRRQVDMCGVIKRPQYLLMNVPTQHCGTVLLDSTGVALIHLPDDFPDEERISRETLRYAAFCTVYSLSAIGAPMPSLHVAKEVCRLSSYSSDGSIPTNGNSKKKKKQQQHQRQKQRIDTTSASSSTGVRSSETVPAPESPTTIGKGINTNIKAGTPVISSSASRGNLRRVKNSVSKSTSFSDFQSLRSAATVSTELRSSPHNDRLIDGPIPLQDTINRYRQQIRTLRTGLTASINSTFSLSHNDLKSLDAEPGCPPAPVTPVTVDTSSPNFCSGLNGDDRSNDGNQFHNGQLNPTIPLNDSLRYEREGGGLRQPLCFVIAGGVPGGKVSWIINTVPVSRALHSYNTKAVVTSSIQSSTSEAQLFPTMMNSENYQTRNTNNSLDLPKSISADNLLEDERISTLQGGESDWRALS